MDQHQTLEELVVNEFVKRYVPPKFKNFTIPDIRLLICGGWGTGKSSLTNDILTSSTSSPHEIITTQNVSEQPTTVTKELSLHSPYPHVCVQDVWGWATDLSNYNRDEFKLIAEGKLKAYVTERTNDLTQHIKQISDEEKIVKRTHCVIFTVPADTVTNQKYIQNLQFFISQAEGSNTAFIIALTKVDTEYPQIRDKPHLIYDSDTAKLREKLSEKLGIPSMDILPVMCYTKESIKNKFIEMSVLKLLKKAIEKAEDWLFMEDMKLSLTKTAKPLKVLQ